LKPSTNSQKEKRNKMTSIRKATIKDLTAILNLQKHLMSVEKEYNPHSRRNECYTEKEIKHILKSKDTLFLIVEDKSNNSIIGCGFAKTEEGELWDKYKTKGYVGLMVVNEEYRGQGIGASIMNKLLDWFKKRKIKDIQLCVYIENKRSANFYSKFGFKPYTMLMRKLT